MSGRKPHAATMSGRESENWCYATEVLKGISASDLQQIADSLGESEAEVAVAQLIRRVLAVLAN